MYGIFVFVYYCYSHLLLLSYHLCITFCYYCNKRTRIITYCFVDNNLFYLIEYKLFLILHLSSNTKFQTGDYPHSLFLLHQFSLSIPLTWLPHIYHLCVLRVAISQLHNIGCLYVWVYSPLRSSYIECLQLLHR